MRVRLFCYYHVANESLLCAVRKVCYGHMGRLPEEHGVIFYKKQARMKPLSSWQLKFRIVLAVIGLMAITSSILELDCSSLTEKKKISSFQNKSMIQYLNKTLMTFEKVSPHASIKPDSVLTIAKLNEVLKCNMSEVMRDSKFKRHVRWDKSNGTKLIVGDCNLDAIDQNLARQCFRDNAPRGVVLIGDSLTRYQYLNLMFFLVHGSWESASALPNENQNKFSSWNSFFKTTNERMGGHEICDCFRKSNRDFINSSVEHRYFDDGHIQVSYRQVFGPDSDIRFHDPALLNLSSCKSRCIQAFCAPGECDPLLRPVTNLGTVLRPGALHALATSHPSSFILFNAGIWWAKDGRNTFADHAPLLEREARRTRAAAPATRLHWKITTRARGTRAARPEFGLARSLERAGAFDGVFDAWALTDDIVDNAPHLMMDHVHFTAPVYAGLNRALIAYICSLPPPQQPPPPSPPFPQSPPPSAI